MSKLTQQQLAIIDNVKNGDCELTKVNAVSGAGKTSTLIAVAKSLSVKKGRYLAYNKAIASEAGEKFPHSITCSTVHSMAYRETVSRFRFSVTGFIKARDFEFKKTNYVEKIMAIELLNDFCLTEHIMLQDFFDRLEDEGAEYNDAIKDAVRELFNRMKNGTMKCTHSFYLKLYHIMLVRGMIEPEVEELLMLDEAGDINPVTLDIFINLPAKSKILVGDDKQNIYSFNNTINGFKELEDVGVQLDLTKSFRVSDTIANKIEAYCNTYLEEGMKFEGVNYDSEQKKNIKTIAYISRTNSSLVGAMIELDSKGIPYNLTRPAKTLFELPLMMIGLKPGVTIYNADYKFLEEDVSDYYGSMRLQQEYNSVFGYVMSVHSDDISIKSAAQLVLDYGARTIFRTYENAQRNEKNKNANVTLTTAHSSKGLEYDEVNIMEDMNECLAKVLEQYMEIAKETKMPFWKIMQNKHLEEFRLAYVAYTRARYKLVNAKFLFSGDVIWL